MFFQKPVKLKENITTIVDDTTKGLKEYKICPPNLLVLGAISEKRFFHKSVILSLSKDQPPPKTVTIITFSMPVESIPGNLLK